MPLPSPITRGKNARLVIMYEAKVVNIYHDTYQLEELGEEITEQVGGQEFAEFDKVVDGYKLSVSGYYVDSAPIEAFIAWRKLRNTNTRMPKMGVGIQLYDNKSGRIIGSGTNPVPGLWKFETGNRKSANKFSVSFFMQEFDIIGR